jgi:hypothetical protein
VAESSGGTEINTERLKSSTTPYTNEAESGTHDERGWMQLRRKVRRELKREMVTKHPKSIDKKE